MIKLEVNYNTFFEERPGSIIIYGCGHHGSYIGRFMELCNIDVEMFIDQKWGDKGIKRGNIPVFSLSKLSAYKGKPIRIILGSIKYSEMLFKLHQLDTDDEYNITCYAPIFRTTQGDDKYDINMFLGYFRKKQLKQVVPTIISNDCTAGMIYKYTGNIDYIGLSPTINVRIPANDYLKIASNPEHYLKIDMEPGELQLLESSRTEVMPTGKIDDVTVFFAHIKDADNKEISKCVKRWNYMKDNIDWNRLVFIAKCRDDYRFDFGQQMRACKYPYRIVVTYSGSGMANLDKNLSLVSRFYSDPLTPIENDGFDFVGWYNELLREVDFCGVNQ